MRLHLLGVNGPFPESFGATSGYLLEAGGSLLQFDLGSGVLGELTALTAPESLTALFVSHWHFDHTADVPVLMYRLQAMDRVLPVYGPSHPDAELFHLVSSVPCFDFHVVAPGDTVSLRSASTQPGIRCRRWALQSPVKEKPSATQETPTRCPPWRMTTGGAACCLPTGSSPGTPGRSRSLTCPRNWRQAWPGTPGPESSS